MKKMLRDAVVLSLMFAFFVTVIVTNFPRYESDVHRWSDTTSRFEYIGHGDQVKDVQNGKCYQAELIDGGTNLYVIPCHKEGE